MNRFDFILYAIGFMLVGAVGGYLHGVLVGLRRALDVIRCTDDVGTEESQCH